MYESMIYENVSLRKKNLMCDSHHTHCEFVDVMRADSSLMSYIFANESILKDEGFDPQNYSF